MTTPDEADARRATDDDRAWDRADASEDPFADDPCEAPLRASEAAGDALLYDVATAIVQTLRSYDVTVRWGGDEFVCALSDVSLDIAIERTGEIQRLLGERTPVASISAGHAELLPTDTLDSVIARADAKLYLAKRRRRS